jgi:hypothetical protein
LRVFCFYSHKSRQTYALFADIELHMMLSLLNIPYLGLLMHCVHLKMTIMTITILQ